MLCSLLHFVAFTTKKRVKKFSILPIKIGEFGIGDQIECFHEISCSFLTERIHCRPAIFISKKRNPFSELCVPVPEKLDGERELR